jgi:ferritin-like metal-binding protein YciE
MDEKSQKTIADYVGDMVALNGHIEEALDRQLTMANDIPVAKTAIQRFHDIVKGQRDALKAYQDEVGTTAGNPIIEAGSVVLGVAAGLIDKIRTEGVSKAIRDDYTAFNHACIGYTMLHVTAVALGDKRTAEMAHKGLDAYAGMVQEINHIIGDVVIAELKKDNHTIVAQNAADENRKMVDHAWRENKSSQDSMMAGMGDSYSASQSATGM